MAKDTTEREELAELFASFLSGSLSSDTNIETWERLRKSSDQTIVNGCNILARQVDDTEFDLQLLDKPEWDYVERARLAIIGNAKIVRRRNFHYGWRHMLSGLAFFLFVFLVVQYGYGYHMLPLTAFFGLAIFAFSKNLLGNPVDSPYHSIVNPFATFSDLKMTHETARPFKKIRFKSLPENSNSMIAKCFWACVGAVLLGIFSPIILLVFAFPDTEPSYQAIAG